MGFPQTAIAAFVTGFDLLLPSIQRILAARSEGALKLEKGYYEICTRAPNYLNDSHEKTHPLIALFAPGSFWMFATRGGADAHPKLP